MGAGALSSRWRQRWTTIATTDNWQTKVDASAVGDRFAIATGTHRNVTFVPKKSQVFAGPSSAIVNGSTVVTNWVSDGAGKWSASGFPTQDTPTGGIVAEGGYYGTDLYVETSPGVWDYNDTARLPNHRTELFRNSVRLMRVTTKDQVVSGKWWFDTATNTAWIADTPVGQTMEHSRVARMIQATEPIYFVTIQGITIEKYACETQRGPIHSRVGDTDYKMGWVYRNVTSRLNHGYGMIAAAGDVVTGCLLEDNGHLGLSGSGKGYHGGEAPTTKIEIAWTTIRRNNAVHHDYRNEGGALKFVYSDGLHIHHCRVHDNQGKGIWADINNDALIFEDNLVYNHQEDGITIEISYGPSIVRNNRIINCGNRAKTITGTDWAWCNGIFLQNSSNADVYNNYIESWSTTGGGGNGWFMLFQVRNEYEGPYQTMGNSFHDNTIVATANAGKSYGGAVWTCCGVHTDHSDQTIRENWISNMTNTAYNNTYKGVSNANTWGATGIFFFYPKPGATSITENEQNIATVKSLGISGWEAGSVLISGDFPESDPTTMTI